tara:strand:+ start:19 stop:225 length:207 start_codon:yes stop_codon:yes gene_type:complete
MGNIEQAIIDYRAEKARETEPVIVTKKDQVKCNNDGVEMKEAEGFYICPACYQVLSQRDIKSMGMEKI